MLKKKYINTHKSLLFTKYLLNNCFLKYIILKKLNFFFFSVSKKENLAIFKNMFLFLVTGKAVNSKYRKLYIKQFFNNLSYLLSFTKSSYSIETFYLFQKLFLLVYMNNVYLTSGLLDQNSLYSYISTKYETFIERFLVYDVKYINQKTFLYGQVNWKFLNTTLNFDTEKTLTLHSLVFFDILNLCSIPFFGLFSEKMEVKQLVQKIK